MILRQDYGHIVNMLSKRGWSSTGHTVKQPQDLLSLRLRTGEMHNRAPVINLPTTTKSKFVDAKVLGLVIMPTKRI
jgi:hypothetical protein